MIGSMRRRAIARVRGSVVVGLCLAALAFPGAASGEPLTLEQAIDTALARNEGAAAARERVRASEARVAQARSRFLPGLTLAGAYTLGDGDLAGGATGRDGILAGTATVSVPLFEARSFPLLRQARLERDGARLEAEDTRQVLSFGVAASFFGALSAEQVRAAAERRLELARATHADARDRAAAGLVGANDVTRAELELWSAERDLTRAGSALEIARLELAFLLDLPVPAALAAPETLLAAAGAARADPGAGSGAPGRRYDVQALVLRTEALRAAADEPRLRLVPSLALAGQLRSASDPGVRSFRSEWLVGATLTWALWDGGLRAAEREERLALAAAGDLARRAAARGAGRDLQVAQASLGGGQAAARQAEAAAAAARRNSQESTILYRQGLAPALAVADASARLFEAEVDLVRARLELAQAFLALRRAAGLDPLGRELP